MHVFCHLLIFKKSFAEIPPECQPLAHTVSKFINRRQKSSVVGQECSRSIKLSLHVWDKIPFAKLAITVVGYAASVAFLNQIISSNWRSFD